MYDRNKGVQSIIDAQQNADDEEMYPKGAIFNIDNGKISHNIPEDFEYNPVWYWLTQECYPLYNSVGNYVGIGPAEV